MKDFHLTILDQTMLRVYVRQLLIFPFPNPQHSDDAIRALRTGFAATLRQLPFLAGTLRPLEERPDRLGLQYLDPISEELIDQIFTADFNIAADEEFDYGEMEREGFPQSKLPHDVFCPRLLRNHPGLDDAFAEGLISFKKGHSVPVLATQATFIPGGLVLSMYWNHSVIDGSGVAQIYRIWSASIRSQKQTEMPNSLLVSSTSSDSNDGHSATLGAQRHAFNNLAKLTEQIDCSEVRYPGTPPRSPALRSTPYNLAARIFVFPASTVSNLTSTISSITNTRISSFTALIALLWTQVTLARSSSLAQKKIHQTTLGIAFDHRKNLDQEYTTSYLGNCATGITTSSPLSAMLSENPTSPVDAQRLAPIALNITQTLSSITLDWFKARLSLFPRTWHSYQLGLDIDIVNGPDLFVTSWMHIGADCVWDIPGTTGQAASAIRKPNSKVEGYVHVLPRMKRGDGDSAFEVLVCLEEGEMERVVERLEMEGWVERVVSA